MESPSPRPVTHPVPTRTAATPTPTAQRPPKLQVVMVGQWTGREAKALRLAMRMSIRTFAEHLGVGVRTVATWESGETSVTPRPEMQEILDAALAKVTDATRARFTYQLFDKPPLATIAISNS